MPLETDQEAFLVAREDGSWCEVYKLTPGNTMTVGREPESRIVLDDDKCSRRHAEIELDGDGWFIQDLSSRNGTKINGTKITQRERLTTGDVIGIGDLELLFTDDIAQPLDGTNKDEVNKLTTGTEPSTESNEAPALEILERKAQTRYVTESNLFIDSDEPGAREAIAVLYRLVVKMAGASEMIEVSELALDGLLEAINVDLGAILLYPTAAEDRSDPKALRIIAYRAPEHTPYHKVSELLSRTALQEKQAILGGRRQRSWDRLSNAQRHAGPERDLRSDSAQ